MLSTIMVSCTAGISASNQNPVNSAGDSQTTNENISQFASLYSQAIFSDAQNIYLGDNVSVSQASLSQFPLFGTFFSAESGCTTITVTNAHSLTIGDDIVTFNCRAINGTIEIKSNEASSAPWEIISSLTLTDPSSSNK